MLHAGSSGDVAGFLGFVEYGDCDCGDAALLDEHCCVQCFAGVPGLVEFLGGDQAFGRDDVAEYSTHSHVLFTVFVPDIAIGATLFKIDFADGHGPAGWPEQPAADQFRFGEGIENQVARRVEIACNLDLAIGGRGYGETVWVEHMAPL